MHQGTSKKQICCDCRSRSCCYHYKIDLSGFDLWRIAASLDLQPARFVVYLETGPEREDGFVLDDSGARYELVLAKTPDPRRHGGCLFLVKSNNGVHRCGLAGLRPEACSRYPAHFHDGLLRVVNNPHGCWRGWSVNELDEEREQRRFDEHQQHRAEYAEIVGRWNRRVWQSEQASSFYEYCCFLENRYGELYPPC